MTGREHSPRSPTDYSRSTCSTCSIRGRPRAGQPCPLSCPCRDTATSRMGRADTPSRAHRAHPPARARAAGCRCWAHTGHETRRPEGRNRPRSWAIPGAILGAHRAHTGTGNRRNRALWGGMAGKGYAPVTTPFAGNTGSKTKPKAGFEPATPCLQDRCSDQLSYSGGVGPTGPVPISSRQSPPGCRRASPPLGPRRPRTRGRGTNGAPGPPPPVGSGDPWRSPQ